MIRSTTTTISNINKTFTNDRLITIAVRSASCYSSSSSSSSSSSTHGRISRFIAHLSNRSFSSVTGVEEQALVEQKKSLTSLIDKQIKELDEIEGTSDGVGLDNRDKALDRFLKAINGTMTQDHSKGTVTITTKNYKGYDMILKLNQFEDEDVQHEAEEEEIQEANEEQKAVAKKHTFTIDCKNTMKKKRSGYTTSLYC